MISQSVRTATAAVGGTLDEALAAIGEALVFEPYYGRTLDALADSLTDLDSLPSPDVIAREIVEDLTAALAEFEAVAASLEAQLDRS